MRLLVMLRTECAAVALLRSWRAVDGGTIRTVERPERYFGIQVVLAPDRPSGML